MTNAKTTRKALLSSVVALMLCFTMLMGTTFAWFTDSVSSVGNTIQSGTLEVDLVDEAGVTMANQTIDFVNVDGKTDILWEPGARYNTENVYVVNKGNLALKYKIIVNGIDGDAKLLEAIDWTLMVDTKEYTADTEFELAPTAKSPAIVLKGVMKTTAGNEYQGLTAEGISITVVATQATEEKDSFDDQYDKDAEYDGEISNAASLAAALKNGGTYKVLNDISVSEALTVPTDVTTKLNLNGKTISNPNGYAITTNGNLTIEGDGVIEGESRAIKREGTGTVTLTGGSYKGTSGAVFSSGFDGVIIDGDVHDTYFDCAVNVEGGNIKNCQFDNVLVTGGTFTGCTFANSNVQINGGTFDFDPSAYVYGYGTYNVVNNSDGTWTVVPDYQAYVGDKGYFSLNDAIDAATDGDTVTIAKDLTRYDGVEIYNKDITIDLNGKTIEVTYGSIIDGCVFKASGTSDVIIKNGTLIGKTIATTAESTATITLVNVN